MKKMEIIFISILIVGIIVGTIVLGCFCYQNRASAEIWGKFIPAIVIGMLGAFFTLWFSLKEEKKAIQFPVSIIHQMKSGKVLELCDKKFDKLYGSKVYQIRRHIKPLQEQEKTLASKYSNDMKYVFYRDLLFVEVMSLIFSPTQEYGDKLEGYITYPANLAIQYFPNQTQTLIWHDFISTGLNKCRPEIKDLCLQLTDPNLSILSQNEIILPKGTTIEVLYERANNYIKIKNKFYEIDVQMYGWYGSKGLGEWKWILEYDNEKNKEYCSDNFNLLLSAKFNRFLSGHPDMPKYKKWINSLFDHLRECLDSEEQLKKAREKHHLYKDNIDNYIKSLEVKQKVATDE